MSESTDEVVNGILDSLIEIHNLCSKGHPKETMEAQKIGMLKIISLELKGIRKALEKMADLYDE